MTEHSMRWKGEFGPATIAVLLQTVGAIVAITYVYAQLQSTADNTKQTTEQLRHLVERQDQRTGTINDRLIKVETTLGVVVDSVAKIDTKIDALKTMR